MRLDKWCPNANSSEVSFLILQLFKCLSVSSSHVLLDVLLTVIVKETDDVYEKVILPSLKLLSKRYFFNEFIPSLRNKPKMNSMFSPRTQLNFISKKCDIFTF